MYKLLKYEVLNSYKYMITFISFILFGFGAQFYISIVKNNSVELGSVISLAVYAGFIAFSIFGINDSLKYKEGMMIFYVPEKKGKILLAKILTIIIYTMALVLIVSLLNIAVGHIPFIGSSYSRKEIVVNSDIISSYSRVAIVDQLKLVHKVLLNVFYVLWSISYILALIITGILVSIISNGVIKKFKLNYIITVALYISMFFIFTTLMLKSINLIPLNYNVTFINDSSIADGGSSFMSMNNASVFKIDYNFNGIKNLSMGFSAIFFNFIWFTIIGTISCILFTKKVEI